MMPICRETTQNYHDRQLILVEWLESKWQKKTPQTSARIWRTGNSESNGNSYVLMMEIYISAANLENNMGIHKKLNTELLWYTYTTTRYISKGTIISVSKRYPYLHAYCSTIHNRQVMESTEVTWWQVRA